MGEGGDSARRELIEASLAQIRGAQATLERVLASPADAAADAAKRRGADAAEWRGDAGGVAPDPDLETRYRTLLARYERDTQAWLDFKRWWKHALLERRRRRRALDPAPVADGPVGADIAEMVDACREEATEEPEGTPCSKNSAPPRSPETAPPVRGATLVAASSPDEPVAGMTETAPSSAGSTPRRNRQHILRHRARIREMLRSDPRLFKGLGRYASESSSRKRRGNIPSEAVADAVNRRMNRRHMHAADCPCCHDYYRAIGRSAPRAKPVWASPSPPSSPSHREQARRQATSRHRSAQEPDPTPPDYWELTFPSTQEALEINQRM